MLEKMDELALSNRPFLQAYQARLLYHKHYGRIDGWSNLKFWKIKSKMSITKKTLNLFSKRFLLDNDVIKLKI